MSGPIMAVGKNLSGIDILKDRQQLITKLYPRGSGSTPSELALDNPGFWPAGTILEYNRSDATWAYFRLPKVNGIECSTYLGDPGYGDGWPINANFCVSKNLNTMYNSAWDSTALVPTRGNYIWSPSDAQAMVFTTAAGGNTKPARIFDVSFVLQRIISDTPTQWATQPRFIVGLYSTTPSTSIPGFQTAGYAVPFQGPLCWCYGNLLSIATDAPQWYTFPMQPAAYPLGTYAIVIMPYPTSNKQWSINDYLAVGTSTPTSNSAYHYAAVCHNGVAAKNWVSPAAYTGVPSGDAGQLAFKLRTYAADVTTQFKMSDSRYPGREVKCPIADYDPTAIYPFSYQHTGYLISWDAYEQYGHYEGTYKDDTLSTQTALLQAGAQYLQSMSQPAMTISLGASDLYDLDPVANWTEELYVGAPVMVIDDVLNLQQQCVITKIDKQDLTQPHAIDTLTLNNVHLSAQKLLAQLAKTHQKVRNYQQGQTVETPYTTSGSVSSGSPAEMTFYIRDATTLTHSVRLTIDTPGSFQVYVDGNSVQGGAVFSGMGEIDVTDSLTQAHNGQPTPGVHTVTVHSPS